MPPEWMWPFDPELELWFEDVERKREERYGGGESSDASSEGMLSNEYSRDRR